MLKKATEQAVGRILLAAEGKDQSQEAACFILDIDKCYENVDHGKIQRAAQQHGFPLAIARLCLDMYRANRAVSWDGVFSTFVISGQTLVPGCSIAVWLLQLVMLTPLDDLIFDIPPQARTPEVYVDDATVIIVGRIGAVEKIAVKTGIR